MDTFAPHLADEQPSDPRRRDGGVTLSAVGDGSPGHGGRPRRDAGVTLPEIIVSVVLMGVLLGAVLTAVQSSVRASSVAFESAQLETVLLNASDRVARAPQVCDYEAYVDAAALAEGWAADRTSVEVELLVANTGSASDWQPQICPADVGPFDVQRLTVSATNPAGTITRTMTMVKSDVN